MGHHIFTPASAALIMTCGLTWLAQPAVAQLQQAPVGGQPTAAGMGKSYPFPARADDLKPDEYWYRDKKIHRTGSAKLAYDLDAVRYDSKEKVWTRYNRGIDPTAKTSEGWHVAYDTVESCPVLGSEPRRSPPTTVWTLGCVDISI